MDKRQLHTMLDTLHEELSQTENLEQETADSLKGLAADIQRLLSHEGQPDRDQADSLAGQLRNAVLKFESEHPRVTGVLNQLVDGLANLGI